MNRTLVFRIELHPNLRQRFDDHLRRPTRPIEAHRPRLSPTLPSGTGRREACQIGHRMVGTIQIEWSSLCRFHGRRYIGVRLWPVGHPSRDEEEIDAGPAATLRTLIVLWDLRERKPFRFLKS
jgi:hypothetical protein